MRIVKVSIKLLESWFTKGFRQVAIEVVEGVPEGSELIDVVKNGEAFDLLFDHPDGVTGLVTPLIRTHYEEGLTPELMALRELRDALIERLPNIKLTLGEENLTRILDALEKSEVAS